MPNKPKPIDWKTIEESNILVLKTGLTIRIKFLDNGVQDSTEIFNRQTKELDTVEKYIFQVLDLSDNKEKEFSLIGKGNRCMTKLKDYQPVKDKEFTINKFSFGKDEFDVDYNITQL